MKDDERETESERVKSWIKRWRWSETLFAKDN